MLETLPETHPYFFFVADQEATSDRALGATERAFRRYENLLERNKRLAQAEPERADHQRDLVISLLKVAGAEKTGGIKSFKRALTILDFLKDSERLATVDEGMIPELKRLIDNLD